MLYKLYASFLHKLVKSNQWIFMVVSFGTIFKHTGIDFFHHQFDRCSLKLFFLLNGKVDLMPFFSGSRFKFSDVLIMHTAIRVS